MAVSYRTQCTCHARQSARGFAGQPPAAQDVAVSDLTPVCSAGMGWTAAESGSGRRTCQQSVTHRRAPPASSSGVVQIAEVKGKGSRGQGIEGRVEDYRGISDCRLQVADWPRPKAASFQVPVRSLKGGTDGSLRGRSAPQRHRDGWGQESQGSGVQGFRFLAHGGICVICVVCGCPSRSPHSANRTP